jgi:hypothetical protein
MAKLVLGLMHLLLFIFFGAVVIFYIIGISFAPVFTAHDIAIWLGLFVIGWIVFLLYFTNEFGTAFFSAFLSPFRWCNYRLGAIIGIFKDTLTYFVRSRAWSPVLEIAMGLEGYRYQLPLVEKSPSSVNFVTWKDMPMGAEQRALTKRRDWISRRFDDVAQTFAKMVVTAADIDSLLQTVEADLSLVHAAYYTDHECIALIADWIAAEDDLPPQARLTE